MRYVIGHPGVGQGLKTAKRRLGQGELTSTTLVYSYDRARSGLFKLRIDQQTSSMNKVVVLVFVLSATGTTFESGVKLDGSNKTRIPHNRALSWGKIWLVS